MGAIYIDPVLKRATIDRDECVECYTCFNGLSQEHLNPTVVRTVRKVFAAMRIRFEPEPDVCPTAAFEPDELTWPRVVRRAFSDPRVPHESTGVEGRGTEEVKTNDVTGRVGAGEVGFTIELGRPGVGVRFRDIQEVCRALAAAGVAFEKKNPVTSLMSDVATGTHPRGHPRREGAVGDCRNQGAGRARRGNHPARVGCREAHRHGGDDWRRRPLRRARRRHGGRADSRAPRLRPRSAPKRTSALAAAARPSRTAAAPNMVTQMTNTLHRFGSAESFDDDFIVFAMACKGPFKQENALDGLRRFLQIALEYGPVNLGDARHGGAIRPSRQMNPLAHWTRDNTPDFQAVVDGLTDVTTCAAVFDDRDKAEKFVKRIKDENLGLSVNVSTSIDGAEDCCEYAGIPRHSVGYSLGFEGKTEKMPNAQVMMLSTMCGHGMISHSLAKKMIDFVKENRRTPEQAAATLTRFCSCGVFNPARAKRILEDARTQDDVVGFSVSAIGPACCWSSVAAATGSTKRLFGTAPASAPASDALVFRNFTLIDGGDREPVQQAAMVVEQGRVSWVGPAADLKAPDGRPPRISTGPMSFPASSTCTRISATPWTSCRTRSSIRARASSRTCRPLRPTV